MTLSVRSFPGSQIVGSASTPAALPDDLVMPPGYYLWEGQVWDCTAERAYRFWRPGADRRMRIVWGGDIQALMRSLAWITAIGLADEALSLPAITNRAVWSKPSLLCSKTCTWAKMICDGLGVTARIVRALTAEPPTNYFDGHVLLEVKISGMWTLFDIAAGLSFTTAAARDVFPLPMGAIVELTPKSVAVEHVASSGFDGMSWNENTLATPSAREAEWRRVLQIVGIDRPNGETWWRITEAVAHRQDWLLALSPAYRAKTPAEFDAAFY